MGRHLTMVPGEGEPLEDFAERVAAQVGEHFGAGSQEAPEAPEVDSAPAEEPAPEESTDAEPETESNPAEE